MNSKGDAGISIILKNPLTDTTEWCEIKEGDTIPNNQFLNLHEIVEDFIIYRLTKGVEEGLLEVRIEGIKILHVDLGLWIRNAYGLYLDDYPHITILGINDYVVRIMISIWMHVQRKHNPDFNLSFLEIYDKNAPSPPKNML